ncbi:hypothetical protein ACIHFE_01255 [Streptomyces sp. NPDC052396]|uniref:hypothetical protein n=1 Tax=Streptomyces sp. NPDC052396 TaxID=3365689 RepID=UPI0037D3CFA0
MVPNAPVSQGGSIDSSGLTRPPNEFGLCCKVRPGTSLSNRVARKKGGLQRLIAPMASLVATATVMRRPSCASSDSSYGQVEGLLDALTVRAVIQRALKPAHILGSSINDRSTTESVEMSVQASNALLDPVHVA